LIKNHNSYPEFVGQTRPTRQALSEIAQRPNPVRLLRSYPRVVKRTQIGDKLIKRAHHRETRHADNPKIQIERVVA
jgi:hypothetical protein